MALHREKRKIGKSSYSFPKKIKLALDRLLSFSKIPIPFYIIISFVIGIILRRKDNRFLTFLSSFSFAKGIFLWMEYKHPKRYIYFEIESVR